jgi:YidC/Oxa1 family membrane protein insertase
MERNAILATVLVILILLGYQWYLSRFEAPPEPPAKPAATAPAATAPIQAPPAPHMVAQPPKRLANPASKPRAYTPTDELGLHVREVVIDTPLMHITLSTLGARATSWQLKHYHTTAGGPVDLVAVPDPGAGIGPLQTWLDGLTPPAMYQVDRDHLELTSGQTGSVVFTQVTSSGIQVEKRLTFQADRYQVGIDLTARNLTGEQIEVQPRIAWGPGFRNSLDKTASTIHPPTLWLDGKRVQEDVAKLNGMHTVDGTVEWAALQDTYFASALLPEGKGLKAFVMKEADGQPVVGLVGSQQVLPPNGEISDRVLVFAGPKDFDLLKAIGHNLDGLVDLGWFWFLARPALWLLKFLYHITGNYGLAIILVTVLQKVAFFPLTQKSLKSMQAMQAIQPKVQALQERFKNNAQKKQEETMALYRKHGVNPMGGCLPMLIQIPIFIALYNALGNSVEMWQAHFLWIRDLTQPDSIFTMTLWAGHEYPFNLLALLMGVSMWVQQKMSPTGGDPRQAQMMLWMMPIIFTFMFWGFPSGLVLYWLVNNILQIGQQYLITGKPARPTPSEAQPA